MSDRRSAQTVWHVIARSSARRRADEAGTERVWEPSWNHPGSALVAPPFANSARAATRRCDRAHRSTRRWPSFPVFGLRRPTEHRAETPTLPQRTLRAIRKPRVPAEGSRHSVFEHLDARAQQRRPGGVTLTGTVPMDERQPLPPHAFGPWGNRSRGRSDSTCERARSCWGGSLSEVPSESGASSTVNPGLSVAISNSTPPGSRK